MVRLNRDVEGGVNKSVAERLTKYGIAAVATVATGVGADQASAALVTTPVNISSTNSVEAFVDILPFASGAATVSVTFVTNSSSQANPLAPNSELMLRGVPGIGQLRPQNGGVMAGFSSGGYLYVRNVGAPFVLPPGGAGTLSFGSTFNGSLTYPAIGAGEFPPGSTGVAFFGFVNTGTGLPHFGWATIFMDTDPTSGSQMPTIQAIHVDTDPIPEPSSMALLCLGAVGVARYRRRRGKA